MKSVKITSIIFILTIVIVVAGFFLLDIEKTAINYWTLGAIVFSSVVALCVTLMTILKKATTDRVFYLAGVNSFLWIYEVLVIIGVVITRLLSSTVGVFIFVQLLINVGLVISLLVISHAAERVENVDYETMSKMKSGEYDKPKRGGF